MRPLLLLLLAGLTPAAYASQDSAAEYERQSHACYAVFAASEDKLLRCLSNTHTQTKQAIQQKLSALKERDRIYVLNTKVLQLNIHSQGCASGLLSGVSVKSCLLNSDLSVLHYLELRYD